MPKAQDPGVAEGLQGPKSLLRKDENLLTLALLIKQKARVQTSVRFHTNTSIEAEISGFNLRGSLFVPVTYPDEDQTSTSPIMSLACSKASA